MDTRVLFWVAVLIYGTTSILTVGLVLWRIAYKFKGPHDGIINWTVKTLVSGVLVETAAAVIGILVFHGNESVPSTLPLLKSHVPVAKGADASGPVESSINAAAGYLSIPQRHDVELVAATTDRWTIDPTLGISLFISRYPFEFDFSKFYESYTQAGFDRDRLFIDAHKYWELLVAHGNADDDKTRPGAAALEQLMRTWFDTEIIPRLEQIRRDPSKTRFIVAGPSSGTPLLADASLAAWRRILRDEIERADQSAPILRTCSLGISGYGEQHRNSRYLCPKAPAGCLVYREWRSGAASTAWQPLAISGIIHNPSQNSLIIEFAINDDIHNDNGPGSADLLFQQSESTKSK